MIKPSGTPKPMPIFADGLSPEACGTAADVEIDREVVGPGTGLVELTGPPLVAPGGIVVAVLVGVAALRVPLGVELTALIISVVLVGVDALGVPLGVELTILIVAVMPLVSAARIAAVSGL